ncbi:MAG: hypothetical protein ACT6U0_17785 [Shinella sp.]|jgi:hypothetical protein|uniref:hypothetical protein n=1 Tax=Shinella sp. TaxID=1870904 RepID=UPI004035F716
MAIIPTEPGPGPGPNPVPDLPPIGEPSPPIKEPEPEYLPDEEPNPNPDENDEPAKQTDPALTWKAPCASPNETGRPGRLVLWAGRCGCRLAPSEKSGISLK